MAGFYEPEVLFRIQQMELGILKDVLDLCGRHDLLCFGMAGTAIGAIRHNGFIPWDDDIDVAMPRKDFERFLALLEQEYSHKYYVLNWRTSENYPLMTTRICIPNTRFVDAPLREVDSPFGIFLDLYVYDDVPDSWLRMRLQAWEAWFFSKLLILRSVPRPYLAQTGWKAKAITAVCRMVHRLLCILRISKRGLAARCERICRRYEGQGTKRMAFYPDTDPFWNVVDKAALTSPVMLDFEGLRLAFPTTEHEILLNMYGNYMELPPEGKRKTHCPFILDFGSETEA